MTTLWGIIIYFHEVVAIIASVLALPNFSTKNLTQAQIENNQKYRKEFFKNFPILTATIIITHLIVAIYWLCINKRLDKNCFVFFYDDTGLKTILYIAIYSIIIIMSLYYLLVKKEYKSASLEIRNKEPNQIKCVITYIYTISICLGMTSVHFVNYYFDNQKYEESIVTVTKNNYFTTREGKNRYLVEHYNMYFEPKVKNIDMIDISHSLQNLVLPGDKIKIRYSDGRCGIPYFTYNQYVK